MITTPLWWAFLLVAPLVYWVLPLRWRAGSLAAMSFGLLMYYAPVDIASMGVLAMTVYGAHRASVNGNPLIAAIARIARSPWPIIIVLAYFFWAKYLPALGLIFSKDASVFDLVIPLGISYFTFKLLHYSLERNRGTLPDHSITDFASYMFLAPIFTAGPIERFDHYLEFRETSFKSDFVFEGLVRIGQGLAKKFVISVVVLEIMQRSQGGDVIDLLDNIGSVSVAQIWVSLFLSLLYVYLDFSAYSDIAIGSSRLFGLRIAENFNLPFLSKSLRDFWQRWHMTLASWVLTYIYMPAVARTRNPYLAIVLTFALVGLWHSAWPAHWLMWGLWHGIGLAVLIWWTRLFQKRRSKFLRHKPIQVIGWAITMAYVALGDVIPALYGQASVFEASQIIFAALGLI